VKSDVDREAFASLAHEMTMPMFTRGAVNVVSVNDAAMRRWDSAVVLSVSTTVNAFAWGARASFALFFVAMLGAFSWGRGPTALGYSLSWLCFVVFAPLAGWLHDRWGARVIVAIGGLALGASLSPRCERARRTRDRKYDGHFFTCVRTTKIYCRPICHSTHALSRNVFFVASAAAAEMRGFRPCLKCRPETAPGSPAWRGTATTVARPAPDRRRLSRRAHGRAPRLEARRGRASSGASLCAPPRGDPDACRDHATHSRRSSARHEHDATCQRDRVYGGLPECASLQRCVSKALSTNTVELSRQATNRVSEGDRAQTLSTGTITCVRERTYGANWYQPRMARNSGVVIACGLSSS